MVVVVVVGGSVVVVVAGRGGSPDKSKTLIIQIKLLLTFTGFLVDSNIVNSESTFLGRAQHYLQ